MKSCRQILSILMVFALCLTLLPLSVLAADEATAEEELDIAADEQETAAVPDDAVLTSAKSPIMPADNGKSPTSGTIGDDLTWSLTDGTLTISGSGSMGDNLSSHPWIADSNKIVSVVIENGVTDIAPHAFEFLTYLTSVTVSGTVTSIGESAFAGCISLSEITIPNSVTSIGTYAFQSCSSLTKFTIPDGVTTIEARTFESCSSLTEVTIPKSVTTIEAWAFQYVNLTDIYYAGSEDEWNAINIDYYSYLSNPTIHYNAASAPTPTPSPTVVVGDVNGDGIIDIKDARALFQYVNKQLSDSDVVAGSMDTNGDGTIDAKDIRVLFQYVNMQIDTLG